MSSEKKEDLALVSLHMDERNRQSWLVLYTARPPTNPQKWVTEEPKDHEKFLTVLFSAFTCFALML